MPEKFEKFAIFTVYGESLPVAYHLKQEGMEVVIAMVDDLKNACEENSEDKTTHTARWSQYHGMLDVLTCEEALKKLSKEANKDEWCIIFDFNSLWQYADQARAMGFKYGLFPTKLDHRLEEDREFAKNFVVKNYPGVKVAEVEEFKTVEEGIEFIGSSDEFWALKGNDSSCSTVVPRAKNLENVKAELVDSLNAGKESYEKKGFILERQIRDGLEVCPQMIWMDGKRVAVSTDIEDKAFSGTNSSEMFGCSLNLIIDTPLKCELTDVAFPSACDKLAKAHTGLFYLDANLILKDGEYYFLEFCFSSDTEVLTKRGWLGYKEAEIGDEVLSINPETKNQEWKKIERKSIREYKGRAVSIGGTNHTVDALVTADHNFFMEDRNGKLKKVKATQLPSGSYLPRTGGWIGMDIPEIVLPELPCIVPSRMVKKGVFSKEGDKEIDTNYSGKRQYGTRRSKVKSFERHILPERKFKTEDMAFFLGFYLAEGSLGGYYKGEPRTINLAQKRGGKGCEEIEKVMKNMGIKYHQRETCYEVNDRRLAHYIFQELNLKNTYSNSKFIPALYKELSVKYLNSLISGYMAGDGSWHKKQWQASSTSKKLIDDLQEIIHKSGMVANIKNGVKKGTKFIIKGKEYTRRNDQFTISTVSQKTKFQIKKGTNPNVHNTEYEGIVWDVTVEDNHTLLVRRNGKAFYSSNCPNRWGFDAVYAEMEMAGSASNYLNAILHGESPYNAKYGAGVRGFMQKRDDGGTIKDGITVRFEEEDRHMWLFGVQHVAGKTVNTKGSYGDIFHGIDLMSLTEDSDDIDYAIIKTKELVEAFSFDGLYLRDDWHKIKERAEKIEKFINPTESESE